MTIKSRYILIIFVALLAACGTTPQAAEMTKVQDTANAAVWTAVSLTQTAMPTVTFPPPTFTPTALPTSTPEATPIPTQPPVPILTPDAIQVEKWEEYQAELAKAVLSSDPELGNDPAVYKDALCEWDILGQFDQEIYMYVMCASAKDNGYAGNPVIIYFESNGSIQSVRVAGFKGLFYDLSLFPTDVQKKFCYYVFPLSPDLPPCLSSMNPLARLDVLRTHLA